jgi:GNAT superfamily N-acetyltransferase
MMLAPRARNQGFGQILLSHLKELAKTGGAKNRYLVAMNTDAKGRVI